MANKKTSGGNQPSIHIPNIRVPGDIKDLRRYAWQALHMAFTVIRSPDVDLETKRSFGTLLTQAINSYKGLLDSTEIKEELETLRAEIADLKRSGGLRKAA